MKSVARVLVLCLIAYTALSMAYNPSVGRFVLVWIGPFPLSIFNALLVGSVAALLYAVSLGPPTDPSAANRVALRLTGIYILYQLVVVMPVAVLVYDVGAGDAYFNLSPRLALLLVPFFYYVALRHLRPGQLVAAVNVAAVALLLFGVYRYAVFGPQGIWEYGEFRLRILWGGATLLFGWLAVTGFLLQRRALYSYSMTLAGILGIVLVNHRSGYVALLFAVAVYVVMSRRVTPRAVAVTVIVVIGGLVLAGASSTIRDNARYSLTTMFNANADTSAQDRVERSALAWDYVRQYPLGDYVWNRRYYLVDLGDEGFEPHNFVIQALDKQGVISAGLLFAMLASILVVGWAVRRHSRLGTAMTVYIVFYLAFCLFNTNFESVQNVSLFALAAAMVLHANRERWEGGTDAAQADDAGTTEVTEAASRPVPDARGPR